MDDGSLQNDKKTMILHTQSYTNNEVNNLSLELNEKFQFHSKVIPHKTKYWVIFIPNKDYEVLLKLVEQHIHPSMGYKLNK